MKKILIIEDDNAIAQIEKDFLELADFDVTISSDGEQGLKALSSQEFNLIILDLMMPKIDGLEVCRRIRGQLDIPILMATAKTEEIDKIRGLGLGADDYISKPFSPTELVARVKAHLNQYDRLKKGGGAGKAEEIRAGYIVLNQLNHRVYVKEKEIELKNKEYELLAYLMANPDMVLSKEQIYERIWDMDAFGDLKTVAVHINRLREKIEDDPQNPEYLLTVWGAGYRFKAKP